MKILVTGASGFVGSWLVRRLVQEQHQVYVLARTKDESKELAEVHVISGDITHSESVYNACKGMDQVFHLAGVVGYSRAMRQVMEQVNVQGTANIVEGCLRARVRRLIHVSSVTAIGASFDGRAPLTEDSPFNLHHLNLGYFETKLAAEKIINAAVAQRELDAVMICPSTIYGPGDAKKGSRNVQRKVAQGKFKFYTSGGVSIVSVVDIVDGLLVAAQKGRRGERYIFCGENITIKQLFHEIADAAGVAPPKVYLPNPVVLAIGKCGDVLERLGRKGPLNSENAWTSILYHWFDCSKAQKELGFRYHSAKQAIQESVHWMKENGYI